MNKRARGTGYEELAANWLRSLGYRIICRNFRNRYGEIDIVAQEREGLVFVEVKFRRSTSSGTPEEAVTHHKQVQICRVADWYLCRYQVPDGTSCRFDVVAVSENGMKLLRNAFPYIPAG